MGVTPPGPYERTVPFTMKREYAFTGTQNQALAEAQRVARQDFEIFPYIAVDLSTADPAPSTDTSVDWTITIRNGADGYLKVSTAYPPGIRPNPYIPDDNPNDGQ